KGAAGIMQLMPKTANRFGVHNRFRVNENIHGGVAYLAWLMKTFGGELRLVTAAYYVGEKPIRVHGLRYSSIDVQGYVNRVARRYRSRRLLASRLQVQLGMENEVIDDENLAFIRVSGLHRAGGSARTADND